MCEGSRLFDIHVLTYFSDVIEWFDHLSLAFNAGYVVESPPAFLRLTCGPLVRLDW